MWAVAHTPAEVREVLLEMTARQAGKSRVDQILYALDVDIRGRTAEPREVIDKGIEETYTGYR